MNSFFAMGGYATYVWSAYGVAFLLVGINHWYTQKQSREQWKQAQRWWKA